MKRTKRLHSVMLLVLGGTAIFLTNLGFTADYVPAPVPRSGQDSCYDISGAAVACGAISLTDGQDGNQRQGVPPPKLRFKDNKNGTVTDRLTNLVWLKSADCIAPGSWSTVKAVVDNLKSKNKPCGLKDGSKKGNWRLPTVSELQTLIDYGDTGSNGLLALPQGNPFAGVRENQHYWSSTNAANLPDAVWVINFTSVKDDQGVIVTPPGSITVEKQDIIWSALPVRSAGQVFSAQAVCRKSGWKGLGFNKQKQCDQFLAANRFRDNGNGTVTDVYTQLIWLKDALCDNDQIAFPNRSTWSEALISVASLRDGMCALADGSTPGDWRLPSVKELQSLIDFRFAGVWSGPAENAVNFALSDTTGKGPHIARVDGNPFDDVFGEPYWSSTTVIGQADHAWTVDLNVGATRADIAKEKRTTNGEFLHAVWPVKGGPVFPTNKGQCSKPNVKKKILGWTAYPFSSQAQCLQYVKIRQ